MSRITYIALSGFVCVDGQGVSDIEIPETIDKNIRAIQWCDGQGEVEFFDYSPNETITSFEPYESLIYARTIKKNADIAALKQSPHSAFHIWDDKKENWVLSDILVKKASQPNSYSVWSDKKNDWVEDDNLKTEADRMSVIEQYKSYLNSTDWYIVRKIETGEDIPEEVTQKRAEAREFLNSN